MAITGIHTEVGKSVVAGALAAGLGWPYWKPVQTGTPRDSDLARNWGLSVVEPVYSFDFPAAPLIAARLEGKEVSWENLLKKWAEISHPVVIEGAGGLFVPLDKTHFFIDFFKALARPLLLVVRPYLGAMNHTWLSLHAINQYGLPLMGLVLCGTRGDPSEDYFRETFADKMVGEIPYFADGLPQPAQLYRDFLKAGIKGILTGAG